MKRLKTIIKHIPFVILLANGIMFLLDYLTGYYPLWLPQITGHGLLSVTFMLFYARLHRCCLYTIICIISLGLLNLLNIMYYSLNLPYYEIYSGLIIFTGIIFALIKWKTQRY